VNKTQDFSPQKFHKKELSFHKERSSQLGNNSGSPVKGKFQNFISAESFEGINLPQSQVSNYYLKIGRLSHNQKERPERLNSSL